MNKRKSQPHPLKHSAAHQSDEILVLIIVALYCLVDFLPSFGRADAAPPQFLYLNLLNLLVLLIFWARPTLWWGSPGQPGEWKAQPQLLFYGGFLLVSAISIAAAINVSLALVAYSKLLVTAGMAGNLGALFRNRLHLLPKICLLIGVAGLLQAFDALSKLNVASGWEIVRSQIGIYLKGNTGNINIFSASLLYKIPFALVGMWWYGKSGKSGVLGLAVFLMTSVVLLINARASLLGFLLILASMFGATLFWSQKNGSNSASAWFGKILPLILPIALALLSVGVLRQGSEDSRFSRNVAERIQDINLQEGGAQVRLMYWKNGFELAKSKPFLGIGLGNWRVESIPHEPPTSKNLSLQAHNDFVELLAETGFINAILFLGFFLALALYFFRKIRHGKVGLESAAGLLGLMVFLVYVNDGFFNFPMYRPTMQVGFALLFALGLTSAHSTSEQKNQFPNKRALIRMAGLVLVALVPLYVSVQSDKAMALETKILRDPFTKNIQQEPLMKAEELLDFSPKLPNVVMASAGSFAEYAGVFLYKEKDFTAAKKQLQLANQINPYLGKADYYLYLIALEENHADSAYLYLKSSFYRRARDFEIFQLLQKSAVAFKDTSEVLSSYRHYQDIHQEVRAVEETAKSLWKMQYDSERTIDFLVKEHHYFQQLGPEKTTNGETNLDSSFAKLFLRMGKIHFASGERDGAAEFYKKGLEINRNDPDLAKNLALYLVSKEDYSGAIQWLNKAIDRAMDLEQDNGETEFALAMCHIVQKNKSAACPYLAIAKAKGYSRAGALLSQNCPEN